jgi:hypothetical protein
VPLWDAQPVTLPDLHDPAYSGPLDVNNWNACAFELQCAAMDIPTPANSHTVATQAAVDRATLLGAPTVAPSPSVIDQDPQAGPMQTALSIGNSGSGLGTWRAQSSQPWLTVSRSEGISLGSEFGGYSTPLTLTVDVSGLPPGDYSGTVTIQSGWATNVPLVVPVYIRSQAEVCSGPISVLDVLAILNNASGIGGCEPKVGDANCDGASDSKDAAILLKFLIGLGQLPSAPC